MYLEKYQLWKSRNNIANSLFDYMRESLLADDCSPDIIVCVFRLLFPDFLEKDGMIFLKEQFSQEKFDQLRSQEMEASKIEYWTNLLAVSDLMPSLPHSFMEEIIFKIRKSWETCLAEAYPGKNFNVELVPDDNDIFLVFNQVSQAELNPASQP
jgi:hypothetical protein